MSYIYMCVCECVDNTHHTLEYDTVVLCLIFLTEVRNSVCFQYQECQIHINIFGVSVFCLFSRYIYIYFLSLFLCLYMCVRDVCVCVCVCVFCTQIIFLFCVFFLKLSDSDYNNYIIYIHHR